MLSSYLSFFFFFNDTATTEIYTLSLHDALPICVAERVVRAHQDPPVPLGRLAEQLQRDQRPPARVHDQQQRPGLLARVGGRSEEHTSELQSRQYLVCRLLLEKKKQKKKK